MTSIKASAVNHGERRWSATFIGGAAAPPGNRRKRVRKMKTYCGMDFGSGTSEIAFLKVKIDRKHARGRARVISGPGCVIAWWERGEGEKTPCIKASAVSHGEGRWSASIGTDEFYAELEVYSGGSNRKMRAVLRGIVANLRGAVGRHVRSRINKGLLLEAPRPEPLPPEEELADTVARQREVE